VTPRIIAMGYPSEGMEAFFRNPASEVAGFLKKFHGQRAWVFNLCSENAYAPSLFGGRVSVYPFDDHW
jgi:phosphatidylinositol-3,4,5-trisphosphate 3-phosphatase/dual-specificity protein phosphatase PTEN